MAVRLAFVYKPPVKGSPSPFERVHDSHRAKNVKQGDKCKTSPSQLNYILQLSLFLCLGERGEGEANVKLLLKKQNSKLCSSIKLFKTQQNVHIQEFLKKKIKTVQK